MADEFKNLEGLLLTAEELQQLTNWNDRVIEDWLELTRNIISLAQASDGTDASLEAHVSDLTIHFLVGDISHTLIQNIGVNSHAQIDSHIDSLLNPHQVTFTQAVTADPATDITAGEAEQLTDGSNADSLHKHAIIQDAAAVTLAETIANIFRVTTTSVIRFVVDAAGNLAASFYPQDTRDDGTVSDEKVLTTDNSGNILLRRVLPYSESYSDSVGGVTVTDALSLYYTFNFTVPEDGDYILEFCWLWSYNSTNQNFLCDILLDGADLLIGQVQEPKDSGGAGINLPNLDGAGVINTGTSQRLPASCFSKRTLLAGAHSVTISIGGTSGNNEAAIYQSSGRVTRDA